MLLLGLSLSGWGILRLANAPAKLQGSLGHPVELSAESKPCGFGLKLSSVAELVELKGRDGRVLFHHGHSGGPFAGMIALDGADPVVFLTVKWAEPEGGSERFAKLTLEPAGKPTLSHYFEAPGTIEDVWELPEP